MLKYTSTAIAAVWGFYGATLVVLLNQLVFSDNALPNKLVDPGLFTICVALFLLMNLVALAALQSAAIGSVPKDKQPTFLEEASTVLLLFHLTLDIAVIALVYDTTTKAVGP